VRREAFRQGLRDLGYVEGENKDLIGSNGLKLLNFEPGTLNG